MIELFNLGNEKNLLFSAYDSWIKIEAPFLLILSLRLEEPSKNCQGVQTAPNEKYLNN